MRKHLEVLDLDLWTERQIIYWIGMESVGLGVKRFLVEYFVRKFGYDYFWCPVWERKGLVGVWKKDISV